MDCLQALSFNMSYIVMDFLFEKDNNVCKLRFNMSYIVIDFLFEIFFKNKIYFVYI